MTPPASPEHVRLPPEPASAVPAEVLLQVQDLQVSFGAKQVLKGISFQVRRGEIFGFIGPNGAGKTTTIRVLATLQAPDAGEVWLDGIDLIEQPEEVRARIGYMPDYVGVYPGLTVLEYLSFFAGAYRIRGRRRRSVVESVIELTELGRQRDTEVQVLSKGMRQRLCLAQTLLHDPLMLILDEPASGLDPRARIEFRALLGELRSMGKTVLLSSHILTELSSLCDAVGIIEDGQLVASGAVHEILAGLRGAAASFIVTLVPPGEGADERDARLPALLLAHPAVATAALDGRELHFRYQGQLCDLHEVFALLARERVSFTSVRRVEEDLESIFMQLTRGVVS